MSQSTITIREDTRLKAMEAFESLRNTAILLDQPMTLAMRTTHYKND